MKLNVGDMPARNKAAMGAALVVMATNWARECGFSGDLIASEPEEVSYPGKSHGFVVKVRENSGKQRSGTAWFNMYGDPSMWTVDGKVGV